MGLMYSLFLLRKVEIPIDSDNLNTITNFHFFITGANNFTDIHQTNMDNKRADLGLDLRLKAY